VQTSSSTSVPITTIAPITISTQNYYACNTCTLPQPGYGCPSSCPNFVQSFGCASPLYGQCISSAGGTGFSGPQITIVTIPSITVSFPTRSTATANECV
jgi:hypothetical protein